MQLFYRDWGIRLCSKGSRSVLISRSLRSPVHGHNSVTEAFDRMIFASQQPKHAGCGQN
ncbi:hypothetical protein I7I51_02332 [Histoplasma capsulatum]|uniref:Uncharacterized protein n=1 Tax=Ajellomyces capsulatus TaxID=5037 RepID=A0A8A1MDB1_AJECA|nr:predicted protein [Histoplasma mississippiense (nom. inval.)]EDN04586.1 predicted protein [Histoplasma mississippiense (nom. inval.)]QSS62594.1 hypothetical protein I7I51_02332 [Histoplasma capsulatum]